MNPSPALVAVFLEKFLAKYGTDIFEGGAVQVVCTPEQRFAIEPVLAGNTLATYHTVAEIFARGDVPFGDAPELVILCVEAPDLVPEPGASYGCIAVTDWLTQCCTWN